MQQKNSLIEAKFPAGFASVFRGIFLERKEFLPLISGKGSVASIKYWLIPVLAFSFAFAFIAPQIKVLSTGNPFVKNPVGYGLITFFGFFAAIYLFSLVLDKVGKFFKKKSKFEEIFSIFMHIEGIILIFGGIFSVLIGVFTGINVVLVLPILAISTALGIYRIYLHVYSVSIVYAISLGEALMVYVASVVLTFFLALVLFLIFGLPVLTSFIKGVV